MLRERHFMCASVLALATLGAGVSAAQTADGLAVEAIVVTAQKRAENVQDVPISMEVLTAERLENFQTRDILSLQSYVPNLLVQPSPGNNAIFIRGFGSQAANYAFDQSVSLYVDGVYGGRNRQFMAPLFDVERIEVLRGPQGALFGKNTAAGAISIVSAAPSRDFHGQVTASHNFDRDGWDTYGFVTGPISESLSGRVALKYTDLGGYIDNTAVGARDPRMKNVSARMSLRFQPSEAVDITARYAFDDFTTKGTAQVRVAPTGVAVLKDQKAAASPFGRAERDDQESHNAVVTANFGLGEHTLTSVSGYSTFKDHKEVGGSAGSPENWLSVFYEDFDQWSQELRLLSPTGKRFEYIAGVYIDRSDYDLTNASRYNLFGGTLTGQTHIDFSQTSHTASAFAQGTFHINERARLLGSLRYTRNRKSADYAQFLDFGIPLAGPRAFSGKLTEHNTDPSITLQYDLAPKVMVYATYGAGSKVGGFVSNTRTISATQFQYGPESSENFEAGFKSTLFDDRVLLNATVYNTRFKDLQVASYDSSVATFVTKNAAKATSRGVEMNGEWRVAEGFRLSGSAAYLDAKFDDFPGAACRTTTPKPCVSENLGGAVLPGASKWTGNVQAEYWRPVGDDLKITATAIVAFRSKFITATDYDPVYGVQDGYQKLDVRLELAQSADRWALALVGKNLTNKLTQSFSYLWPLSTPATGVQFLDETRTVSLEARLRF